MDLLYTDAIRQRKPKAFQVMVKPVGSSCNLNCTYCYYLEKNQLYGPGETGKMKDEVLENFIKQHIEAHEVPVVSFTWQGGEPCLAGLEYFRNIVRLQEKYARGKRIENAFQTNGTLLTDDWGKFFHDHGFLLGISIDGPEHIHDHFRKSRKGEGSFFQAMKGIEILHRHRVEFNTLSCVNSYNAGYAMEAYRFLKNIGSRYLQFIPIVERIAKGKEMPVLRLVTPEYSGHAQLTEWSVGSEEYGVFLTEIFDHWVRNDVGKIFVQAFDTALANWLGLMPGLCVFSETCGDAFVLEHNGDLYSCDHFVYPEYLLGNIRETSLKEMVRSQAQFDFGIRKRNALPKYCLRCKYRFACQGGCPKNRIAKTPDGAAGLNHLCPSYQQFFHHIAPYMEFMAGELRHKRPPANVMEWIRKRENPSLSPPRPERNAPCPCGSGKKYKHCCGKN